MKGNLALWTGLLAGPIIWFFSLEAKFALAPWICTLGWKPAAYGVSLSAFAMTAGACIVAWRQWQQVEGERPRAMALGGVLMSGAFLIVLLAQTLPELILAGCE